MNKPMFIITRFLFLHILFISIIALVPGESHGNGSGRPISGIYDNTVLGFDEDTKIVTGYFFDSRGDGDISPVFNCSFFFSGVVRNTEVKLAVIQPTIQSDTSHGKLIFHTVGGKAAIRIILEEEQPGCMNVYPKDELRNDELVLNKKMPWKKILIVSKSKAFFAKTPSKAAITKRYVVKGDVVGMIEEKNGWVHTVFRSRKSTTEGWLTKDSFYQIENPKK